MSFLNQLKIRTKLTAFLLIVALLMVGSGAIELYGLRSSRDALSSVYQNHLLAVNLMNEIRNRQMQIRLDLVTAQKIADEFEMVEQMDRIRSHIFQIQTRMEEYSTRTLSPEERTKYEAFVEARKAFGEQSVLPMMDMLTQKEFARAERLRVSVMNPTYQKASDAIDALIQHQLDEAKSEYEHVSALATRIQMLSLIVILGGVGLAVLLGFVILRSISQGVSALEKATSRLAAGDLSSRVKTDARDEIGAVADSFNAMAGQFAALIGQVRASAMQVSGVVNTLSATSDKVATVSRSQTEQAAAAADFIESINAAIGEIARSTDQAVSAANQASGTADRGRQVVTTAVEAIEQVASTVNGASQLVGSLGQRSNQIGQIIQVINDIAEQTNLLALNAAIEAARAGDQGRGFAVVADEVRSLAERTAGATSEIAQMIKAIQNETASVVSSMEQGNRQVGAGVSQAKEALSALSQISTGVHQVVSMIQNIAEATRNQSSATGEITRRVEGIAGLAKDNRSLIEEAAQTAHDLQRLSAGFQETVGRFQG